MKHFQRYLVARDTIDVYYRMGDRARSFTADPFDATLFKTVNAARKEIQYLEATEMVKFRIVLFVGVPN